jgi:hypothetical protein
LLKRFMDVRTRVKHTVGYGGKFIKFISVVLYILSINLGGSQ